MTVRLKLLATMLPALLAGCQQAVSAPAATHTAGADPGHPEVVELFQSQGCSSCPPANRLVMPLADRPDTLVLSWQVTYWDHLGWKDKFADPAFTARQWSYARKLGHNQVWTPQVVVNGRGDVIGSDPRELSGALHKFQRGSGGPVIALSARDVRIEGGAAGASLELVRYDPKVVQVPILAGENSGATLPHRNVVKEYAMLGAFHGGKQVFSLPAARHPGLKTAILVQQGEGGAILAAAHD
jgi:hypothetical protein